MNNNKIVAATILLTMTIFFGSCRKFIIPEATPECIKEKVIIFKSDIACEDAKVKQFSFQGKTVFTFDPGTCGADEITEIFDKDCNFIGALGGIIGNTKINNEEFSNAIFMRTVWKK